ncbi:LLM class flavin-dependent oxidoreductase [Marinomonas ostreistagni]|uniref:LLM class flavin-dependent oxidoreductase n=1 Tax=Marinomonas ostreistagni TaxID=359209 RepID=UPI00194E71D6|nr:LLM class flavin-dependent oxidoreductase [Marinomonas ostreistagni]MBM6550058.1 LLM class flavin-dependent oxidoreductase [Marinomonas ostreistagni]
MTTKQVPLSVLDLIPIGEGFNVSDALHNSTRLAQAAETAGFKRYWVAEHHNLKDIASAATSVILSHIGAKTDSIRLGSGGIMLPNHAPLLVAEQFATLESLYPGRIDLGLGRAPGTDMETARALRRDQGTDFPEMLAELQYFFSEQSQNKRIKAVPGAGMSLPTWLLGSSTFSAQLAAAKGLPMAFAAHFAPDAMLAAIELYRANYQPSEQFPEPYVMVCVNAVGADTQAEAEYLATTELQKFLSLNRGTEQYLPEPVEDMNALWSPSEAVRIKQQLRESIWGTKETIRERLNDLVARTGADEVMVNSWIHDPEKRIYSHQVIAAAWR